jgi:hypothetical protein
MVGTTDYQERLEGLGNLPELPSFQLSATNQLNSFGQISNPFHTANAFNHLGSSLDQFSQALEMDWNMVQPSIFQITGDIQWDTARFTNLSFDFDFRLPTVKPEVPSYVTRREVEAYSPVVAYTLSEVAVGLWASLTPEERLLLVHLTMAAYCACRLAYSDFTIEDFLIGIVESHFWSNIKDKVGEE